MSFFALTEEQVREAHRLWKSGKTQAEVAAMFYVDAKALVKAFKRHGLPLTYKTVKRPVKNLTTGETFPSITAAGKAYNKHPNGIGKVCKGEMETCGGMRWAYADDEGGRPV